MPVTSLQPGARFFEERALPDAQTAEWIKVGIKSGRVFLTRPGER